MAKTKTEPEALGGSASEKKENAAKPKTYTVQRTCGNCYQQYKATFDYGKLVEPVCCANCGCLKAL